jgi:tRNA uridine 5-carboxymethylaminomethyl modification enzyme
MFTSRAEYRLMLREDNADLRLTEVGRHLGLVDDERWQAFNEKRELIEQETQRLRSTYVVPGTAWAEALNARIEKPIAHEYSLMDLLRRPELEYGDIVAVTGTGLSHGQATEQVQINAKYEGYIVRQQEEIDRMRRSEDTRLPDGFDYSVVSGLSNEIRQKLHDSRPVTLGQASRIPGVTPAAISLLMIHLKKFSGQRKYA